MRLSKNSKPTKDEQFLKAIRELPCLACGKYPAEAHHIKTRGSGGGDDWWNVIPLCNYHHTGSDVSWHKLGAISFLERFEHVKAHLEKLGWEQTQETKKIYNRKRSAPLR